jgi:succinoglycan biosynthesis protein ExoO
MTAPLVSVVIAAYNVASYVGTAIRSALGQTVSDIEVIVVEDGSSDNTLAIVEGLAAQDARMRFAALGKHQGVSAARNHGLDMARGTWIAVLDADDWMAQERLSRLVAAAEALGADWIVDDLFLIRDGASQPVRRLMADEPGEPQRIDGTFLVAHNPPGGMGYGLLKPLTRRSFLDENAIRYHADLWYAEDFLFNMECAAHGARLAILNAPMYFYRLRSSSAINQDRLMRVAAMKEANTRALSLATAHGANALAQVLAGQERLLEREWRYARTIVPIARGELGQAIIRLFSDPFIFPYVAQRLVARASRYLMRGDPA